MEAGHMRAGRASAAIVTMAIAGSCAGAARAEPPSAAVHRDATGVPRQPGIPGTLDPATGIFRPDPLRPDGAGSSLRGHLDIVFNLDAVHATSTSVECVPTVVYYLVIPPGTNRYPVGSGTVMNAFLSYDSKNKKFVGTLPDDFAVASPISGSFVADISISCYYTFDRGTPIFTQKLEVPLEEVTLVPVNGVMDGRNPRAS